MQDAEMKVLMHKVALSGDQQAFKQIFWHYYDYLFYFSNSFVKCGEIADEIVEDVFISIWNKREKLPEIANLTVYLYVAVKHLSINHLTRSGYRYTGDLNELDVSCPGITPTPEDLVVASDMSRAINKAVGELPPKCRIIFKLVKEDGLRYKEVAEILHISPRTVENHIATALRKIAKDIHIDFKNLNVRAQKSPQGI